MVWSDNLNAYLAALAACNTGRLFEPIGYEYPIPGEPLIRRPIYRDTIEWQTR